MNHDLALISAILESGGLGEAIKSGVKARYLGPEAQIYWDALMDHHENFGEVPSLEYFSSMFPSYEHHHTNDSIQAIAHELKTRYLHSEIDQILEKVVEANMADPWEARTLLSTLSDSIYVTVQKEETDLVAGSDKHEVMKRIEYLRNNHGLLGYEWPWPFLNANSKGLCPGNFVYFYGREKSRKTFLLCYLATWLEALGLRVLFFTREMTVEEIAWRIYPMRSQLPYRELTAGAVSADGLLKLEDVMDDLLARKNLIITEADGGIAGMRAKIEEVKPSVVIHDYLESVAEDEMEMRKGRGDDHKMIAWVAGQMKRMAMKYKIPIIGCGHANREGEKLKGKSSLEYAGSDKIVRRVDYGFRIITDDSTDRMAIILNAGRESPKFLSMTVDATLCNGFGNFISDDTSWVDNIEKAREQEENNREEDEGGPPSGTKLSPRSFTTFRR